MKFLVASSSVPRLILTASNGNVCTSRFPSISYLPVASLKLNFVASVLPLILFDDSNATK